MNFKPWYAALRISSLTFLKAGYSPLLGLDFHYANLAAQREMPFMGLETMKEQMGFFNKLDMDIQRQYFMQTLKQLPDSKPDLAKMEAAWRMGNLEKLNAMAKKDFAKHPKLRKILINQRNHNWMPTLKHCLSADQGCFVVVGAEHMAGDA